MTLPLAAINDTIADFLGALLTVYTLIIVAYVISNIILQFARPAYSPTLDAVLGFLRDVSEPYLRIFRRFVPMLGPIDITPIVAILVLQIVGGFIVALIANLG